MGYNRQQRLSNGLHKQARKGRRLRAQHQGMGFSLRKGGTLCVFLENFTRCFGVGKLKLEKSQ